MFNSLRCRIREDIELKRIGREFRRLGRIKDERLLDEMIATESDLTRISILVHNRNLNETQMRALLTATKTMSEVRGFHGRGSITSGATARSYFFLYQGDRIPEELVYELAITEEASSLVTCLATFAKNLSDETKVFLSLSLGEELPSNMYEAGYGHLMVKNRRRMFSSRKGS